MSIKGFKINDKIEKIDYESLENKPFYTETITEINRDIIPLQEVEGVSDGMPEGYLGFILEELDSDSMKKLVSIADKGQYNLTIDGTTEQITTIFDSDTESFLFGNLSIAGMGDDTGEIYVGMIYVGYDEKDGLSAYLTLILQTTETTHTIGLSHIGDVAPIIAEDTYSFENIEGGTGHYFTNMWEASFEGDNVYNLTFDDEIYEGLSWIYHEDSGLDFLGNLSIMGMGDDTGEKYLLARIPQDDGSVVLTMVTSCEAGNYTVSLEKSLVKTVEIIHKIDNKYLDVNVEVPYTEDAEGNVVFEKDIYINHSTSVGEIKDSVESLQTSMGTVQTSVESLQTSMETVQTSVETVQTSVETVQTSVETVQTSVETVQTSMGTVQTSVIDLQKKINSVPEFDMFNTNGIVLENGSVYPSNGISTNSNPPNGYNAWIEGSAGCSVYTTSIDSSQSALTVSTTTSGKTTTTKVYLDLYISTTDADSVVSQLQEYDYIGVRFADDFEKEYYVIPSSFYVADVSNIQIYFSFLQNGDIFSVTNSDNGRIIHSCSAYKNLGENSHSEGCDTMATGSASHAEGYNTKATGSAAHAEGWDTQASGGYSHAEGYGAKATGGCSHAEGENAVASGRYSHAEGYNAKASKISSHAEGSGTKAYGDYSHAEGYGTEATGEAAHAEGWGALASGRYSHAEGYGTEASGGYSHVQGGNAIASGDYSHAEGRGTKASGDYSHVQGKYNIEDTENKYAHIIGNGDSTSGSNAHTIDWDGNAWFAGTIEAVDGLILNSSTSGSSKKFIITVDDSGNLIVKETTTE